jgi:excisionase family DNA binding protein
MPEGDVRPGHGGRERFDQGDVQGDVRPDNGREPGRCDAHPIQGYQAESKARRRRAIDVAWQGTFDLPSSNKDESIRPFSWHGFTDRAGWCDVRAVAGTDYERTAIDDLISIPEAARRIGVHSETLYRLCRKGQFPPAVQIGARWRVSVPRMERHLHGEDAES